jgi:hypothetical protein
MAMKTCLHALAWAGLLSFFFAAVASAQDIKTNVIYLCNGERIVIDSCNMRDLSDTSGCLVGHPDTVMPNGLMKYTNETRGNLKKLLPTCKQPTAAELKRAQDFNNKVYGQQNGQQPPTQSQAQNQPQNLAKAQGQQPAPATAQQQFQAEVAAQLQASQNPQARAMNRCISSGRQPGACSASARDKSLGKAVNGLAGLLTPGSAPIVTSTNGPQMAGAFEGKGWRLEFDDEGGVLLSCAGMNSNPQTYQVAFVNNRAVVTITSTPKPIVLTVTNDGLLTGPAPIVVNGTVPNGSHMAYDDQRKLVTYFDYKDVTRTCEQPLLTSKGVGPTKNDRLQNFAANMLGGDTVAPPPPGVRMAGTYAVASGFSAEFHPDSVVLGCGPDIARAYPYSVVADGSQVAVKVDAPHPLTLVVKSNNTFDPGPGSYLVEGKLITGRTKNGDYTYVPRSATCNLAVLAPGEIPNAAVGTTASAAAAPFAPNPAAVSAARGGAPPLSVPGAATGNAVLTILSGFPNVPGKPNPLGGQSYTLLRDDFSTVVAKSGAAVPPGIAPFQEYALACGIGIPDCQKITDSIRGESASSAMSDATGKAVLPGVPPGRYFLMISIVYNGQPLFWNFKVDLKAGQNTVTLDQRNAVPLN